MRALLVFYKTLIRFEPVEQPVKLPSQQGAFLACHLHIPDIAQTHTYTHTHIDL